MARVASRWAALAALCLVVSAPVFAQDAVAPPAAPAEAVAGQDRSAQSGVSQSGAAQDPAAQSSAPQSGVDKSGAAAGGDPWGFEDEEEAVPTWGESILAQAPDLALFIAFSTLALVSFFRKSEKLKVVTLIAAVGYLGLYKSQIISVVNIFGVLVWNLPILRYSLGWYLFAIFTVVSTVLWGRLYCGRICAFGAMTQLLDKVVPARLRVNIPKTIERRAGYIKYGILAGVVTYYLITRDHLIFRYVEPFWMFTFQGNAIMWTMLAVLLTGTLFVRNMYCRFLCPVGASLGLISQVTTVFRIKRWSECGTCKICEKTCEWGAIRGPKIIRSECVRCDDCERLYANEQKCPHWIIFYRKDEIAARRAAQAAALAARQGMHEAMR